MNIHIYVYICMLDSIYRYKMNTYIHAYIVFVDTMNIYIYNECILCEYIYKCMCTLYGIYTHVYFILHIWSDYICICVYIYVHMCVYICIYAYVYVYI